MPAERRYRAVPTAALHRVELDALTAVFDRRSGQTHLLAAPLPELLEALGSASWSLPDFARHVAEQFDLTRESTDDLDLIISQRLDELAALGLVEIA